MNAGPDTVEQVLQGAEDRYRLLAENVRDVIFTLDLNFCHTYCSPSVERLRGYTVEEVMTQTLEQVLTPASYRTARKILEAELARENTKPGISSGSRTVELELTCKRGDAVRTEVKVSFLRDQRSNVVGILGVARDITERRLAEDRLGRQRRTFLSVLEHAPYGILLLNKDGRSLYANSAFTEITGYTLDDTPTGREWFRKAYPDRADRNEVISAWKTDLAGAGRTRIFRVRCKDQSLKDVEFKSAVLDDGGTVTMLSDITERVEAEEELRQSGERFLAIANYTYGAEAWVGTDGKLIWVNPGILRLTGYSDEDCLAMSDFPLRIVDEADKTRMATLFAQAVNDKSSGTDTQFRVRCRDGSLKWAAIEWQPIYASDGTHLGHRASVRDISARKNMEEALLASQFRLSEAMDLAKIVYWDLDYATETFVFDDSFYAFYRTTAEQEGGYRMAAGEYSRRFIHPDDRAMVRQSAENNRLGKEAEFLVDLEHRIIRRDGEVRYILARTRGFRDAEGHITRCYGANQDITERKQAEKEKAILESQLRQAQKMEAIGTLSAGIAHDFKNILMAVEGFANLAIEQIQDDSRVKRYLDRICRAVERGKDLVRQILTFSHKGEYEPKPMELTPVVRESVRMLRASLHPTVAIKEDFTVESSLVLADPTQMQQIILNLTTNAAYAMGQKGGTLTIALSEFSVASSPDAPVPGMKAGPYLKLSISDTGTGMDTQTMERVFDPFFTTKKRTEGTGLGLWVVHSIVKKHRGAITVKSALGEGSTFDVFLPRIID
jgi:PAS domain S-box-containing protein